MERRDGRIAYWLLVVAVFVVLGLSFQQVTYTRGPGCIRPACGGGGNSECGESCCCGIGGATTPPCDKTNDVCVVK
jgi:hypothetical protein